MLPLKHLQFMLILLLKLSFVRSSFNRSQISCEELACYSQLLFDPFLKRTSAPRCSAKQIDCIATFLVPSNVGHNSSTDLQSNENDPNKMLILVCSKLSTVDEITLSLNLNGEIFDSSFSFTFNSHQCSDCSANLVERTDLWKEDGHFCSAFRFQINQPYSKNKEILYINRVGYYLTSKVRSKGVLHQARTQSFAYEQSLIVQTQTIRPCREKKVCLFFRGQNINEQCVERNDCTGRLMIHRTDKRNDRLVSIHL